MKPSVLATVLLLLGSKASSSQPMPMPPCLPSLETLITSRLELIKPQHDAAIAKAENLASNNRWGDKLLLDRVTGGYTMSKGLTLGSTSEDGVGHLLLEPANRKYTWEITYSVPLNFFRQKQSADAISREDLKALRSKQALEDKDAEIDVTLLHNSYLEAKAKFLACRQSLAEKKKEPTNGTQNNQETTKSNASTEEDSEEKCLEKGYKLRELALKLSLISGKNEYLARWKMFLNENGYSFAEQDGSRCPG